MRNQCEAMEKARKIAEQSFQDERREKQQSEARYQRAVAALKDGNAGFRDDDKRKLERSLEDARRELDNAKTSLSRQIQELSEEKGGLLCTNAELLDQVRSQHQSLQKERLEKQQSEERFVALRTRYEPAVAALKNARREFDDAKTSLSRQIQELSEEKGGLLSTNAELLDQVRSQQESLDELRKSNVDLQQRLEKAEDDARELQRQVLKLGQWNEDLRNAQKGNDEDDDDDDDDEEHEDSGSNGGATRPR